MAKGKIDEYAAPDIPEDVWDLILETSWENLHYIQAAPILFEIESAIPTIALKEELHGFVFYDQLRPGLEELSTHFDVIVIDFPPNMGYLSMNAIAASHGLVIPSKPNGLDFAAKHGFFLMMRELTALMEQSGGLMLDRDCIKILATQYEPKGVALMPGQTEEGVADIDVKARKKLTDQKQVLSYMRAAYGDGVLTNEVYKSAAIENASRKYKTIYELDNPEVAAGTLDRAIASMDAVCAEIREEVIFKSLEKQYDRLIAEEDTNV